ncbi:tyrosine-type recombinase/integrase [Ferroacidibacillus organovorans]|uniref:tyrosine-type recombinase/integrase n=1 Tax=Ferroacidibacillus organovorans TaxID=1765683 RepID=UPI0018D430D1|nr:tyrosine-type recombinase/integrase [Ferroacidibacillus organovorans]
MNSILESCHNIKHKAMLMVVYSSGLRVSEAAALKIQHIDSKNMRLFVQNGKGGKDRYTLLSDACLNVLRKYWKEYRPKHPEGWLFLGTYNVTHITPDAIGDAFNKAVQRAHIAKQASIHALRHSFATHLLEDGATLLQIKSLLGHASVQSTTIYLHLANMPSGIVSPLDSHSTGTEFEVSSHA